MRRTVSRLYPGRCIRSLNAPFPPVFKDEGNVTKAVNRRVVTLCDNVRRVLDNPIVRDVVMSQAFQGYHIVRLEVIRTTKTLGQDAFQAYQQGIGDRGVGRRHRLHGVP